MLKGTLHDSLTSQPVAQGMAIFEQGSKLATTPLNNFLPTQQVATDTLGAFSFCARSITYPAVLVLEAMDVAGKAYPPYVAQVTGAVDFGTIAMGGCTGMCGLAGEQQTTLPATITGTITSTPAATTGTVTPSYAMGALDNSKAADGTPNLWSLALPLFPTAQSPAFTTVAGACGGSTTFCATYTVSVPSQKPIYPVRGGTVQSAGTAVYLVEAAPANLATCGLAFLYSSSILMATPGAQLTAQPINLMNCLWMQARQPAVRPGSGFRERR